MNKHLFPVALLGLMFIFSPHPVRASGTGEVQSPDPDPIPVPAGVLPPIDALPRGRTETAVFGQGCFWGVDARFGQLAGVVRTRTGYAGGTSSDPTYQNIGDHTEVVEAVFDPDIITYEELLTIFWETHIPTLQPYSRQYTPIVLYTSQTQRRAAETELRKVRRRSDSTVFTEVAQLDRFYQAEYYHQKYGLKNRPSLLGEIQRYYDTKQGFLESTAAARINGYIMGNGDREQLEAEIDLLGLSEEGKAKLRKISVD